MGTDETGKPARPFVRLVRHKRDRVRAEIEANRRGEFVVPTWALALALLVALGAWAALVILS
jgi:hypothetical protein